MTDRPIIFSADMAMALLAGRKTMTRRLASRPNGKPSLWRRVGPGDRLWVREALKIVGDRLVYAADGVACTGDAPETYVCTRDAMPGIFMPRWASRLTLTVTAVRIERLQEMSYEDALAEGAPDFAALAAAFGTDAELASETARRLRWPVRWFADLWDALHGDVAWYENSTVVALTFTVAHRNIDAQEAAWTQ